MLQAQLAPVRSGIQHGLDNAYRLKSHRRMAEVSRGGFRRSIKQREKVREQRGSTIERDDKMLGGNCLGTSANQVAAFSTLGPQTET